VGVEIPYFPHSITGRQNPETRPYGQQNAGVLSVGRMLRNAFSQTEGTRWV